mgnify:FL=1
MRIKRFFISFVLLISSCSSINFFNEYTYSYNAKFYIGDNFFYKSRIFIYENYIVINFIDVPYKDIKTIEINNDGKFYLDITSQNAKIIEVLENYKESYYVLLNKCLRGNPVSYGDKILTIKCDKYANINIDIFDLTKLYINGLISMKLERAKKTPSNVK